MIFVVSKKGFSKHDKKWLKRRDYLIIDGSDSGEYNLDLNNRDIAAVYSNVVTNGAFTPRANLIAQVKKEMKKKGLKKDDFYDKDRKKSNFSWKTQDALNEFLKDRLLTAAIVSTVKGQTAVDDGVQRNIFVILETDVYKILGDRIVERFYELFKVEDWKFVYTEEELEDDKKLLKKSLKKKQIKYLQERIERLVKKKKLNSD